MPAPAGLAALSLRAGESGHLPRYGLSPADASARQRRLPRLRDLIVPPHRPVGAILKGCFRVDGNRGDLRRPDHGFVFIRFQPRMEERSKHGSTRPWRVWRS